MSDKPVCASCGSDDVVGDAAVRWIDGDWDLVNVFDRVTCEKCGYEGYPEWESENA